MPDAADFLAGFGLTKGTNISGTGYIIQDVTISHNEIVRYRKYEYPIVLTIAHTGQETDALFHNFVTRFEQIIGRKLVINSRYGNPYECSIEYISGTRIGNSLVITLLGKSHRV